MMTDSKVQEANDEGLAEGKVGGDESNKLKLVGPGMHVDPDLESLNHQVDLGLFCRLI